MIPFMDSYCLDRNRVIKRSDAKLNNPITGIINK